ncbi:MAG TPA: TolC family protein [Polyangia bacterium]|nr:TolC family protein [Polyangia bacterium]
MRSVPVALAVVAISFTPGARAAETAGLPRAVDVPSPTGAPEPGPISLRDAIARAAAGNIQLLKQNVALRSSEGNVVAQLGAFDFTLAGDGTYSRNVNPSLGKGDPSAGSTNGAVFDLSLTRALESGGNLTLALQGRGSTSTQSFTCGVTPPPTSSTTTMAMMAAAQVFCYVYAPSATLTFTQPVLRGFGSEIAEANLRKARISNDLALLNRQAQAANTVRDTIIAYWELAYQTQDLDIQRFSEQLAREQLRTTEVQVQVGKMGDLAAAALRRAIATAQQAEATSEQALMGRALDLQRLFGAAVPRTFVGYKAADALEATKHDVDVDTETQHALAASPALRSIKMGLQLTQSDLRVARDSMRPLVNIVADVSEGGRNHDLGTSVRQLFEWDDREYSIGFNFALPVQNRAARGAQEVAQATEDSAELDAHDLELSIRDTVARMAAQIRSAGARIEYGRAAVTYSEDNLKAEMARFQVGTSTNNDVLLRQQELKQAQQSVARAIADLLEGDVALAALTGDLLETYGITLR